METPLQTAITAIGIEGGLRQARDASYRMGTLSTDERNSALERLAGLIEENRAFLVLENRKDLREQEGRIPAALYQRLKLDEGKLSELVRGIRQVISLPDPVGRILSRTLLAEGLILEKKAVPLGVIGIVFESRPDVLPQILSLVLKSGNAVVFKGGSEAHHSNRAFLSLVERLNREFGSVDEPDRGLPVLPVGWVQFLESREGFREMLAYPEYMDLVIPRGSYALVRSVMESTKIPVLGHAEGVCHLYVHASADLEKAVRIAIDAKSQYPAACNALETLLVDEAVAARFLPQFAGMAREMRIRLKGCAATRRILPAVEPATEEDWRTEYGDLVLSVKVVRGEEEAIDHINTYGSHHTDGILAEDKDTQERFLREVDSTGVFVNASTRFADGYRFGLGAEIGIGTGRFHARGPVGLEGLTTYKYVLRGRGQTVAEYTGRDAKPFLHRRMPC